MKIYVMRISVSSTYGNYTWCKNGWKYIILIIWKLFNFPVYFNRLMYVCTKYNNMEAIGFTNTSYTQFPSYHVEWVYDP